MEKAIAIILMGGAGKRLGEKTPKQYLPGPDGKPMFLYSVRAFSESQEIDEIILAVPDGYIEKTENMCKSLPDYNRISIVTGGRSREDSAYLALMHIRLLAKKPKVVLIHDAARPCVTTELINRAIYEAAKGEGAIPVIPLKDSAISLIDGTTRYIKRDAVSLVQTPQAFPFDDLLNAFEDAIDRLASYNDEGELYLAHGGKLSFVEGSEENAKITSKEDYARWLNGK